ncbi:X-ray repair cross-complementing protein 5 isoform X4 [Neophocaena asiaeorientalis asiaeorientalis]|uniref:X-ray repair cross-complementing protein 5 n=1 Tax=Neophocaena asiaeorientalis asiaeorientalis TaxID=1706337 RepID=A0A341CW83_NEOAA|nr:X-ray repair cross-complementing protein 5 isoform X4 [Neophocaena asiaeorientalis asiaeorientalis]
MARSGNKAAVVLCMDVRFAMSNSVPGEESPFELAKKVVTMFVQRQVFAESKDEIALVLFGTDGTENALAGEGQYQNITVHRHLMLPDFDLLEDIESKIQPGSQQADFLDALIVCMDLIQQETVGKKFEKRHIEVFTDLSSPFSRDQLGIIIHNLKKSGISLQFFLPFPVGKEDGTGDRGDGNLLSDHHGSSFPPKGISDQQKEGIRMVKKVMMSLEGEDGLEEIYSFSESLRQLCVFKKIERRSMPWPCQLTIGSNLSIKIVAYKSILQERVKKCWTVVDARTQKKEDIQKETVYCLNDDDETEVPREDTIQGFRYGSDIIPFSKVDEEQMKYKSEGKCFSVLGFCTSSQVHMKYFMGNQVLKVFATKDDEAAAVALSSLIHALDELDMVAIVRYAYDRRANPQVGVAFPYIRDTYECLVYVQLPFMEDLRQYMFSSLKNNRKCTPTEAQLSAVDALIDSMSLVKKDEEEGTIEDLFPTSKIPNPQFQRLFQCLLHRALHPQEPLPPIQQHILNMLDPPTEVTAKCQVPVSKIKTLFPLTEVLKKKDQVTAQDIFPDNHEEGPISKKLKTEGDEAHFSISSLAEGSVTRVGSVNPAENFRVLVRQKKTSFEEASHQLINHIEQFLDTNETLYFMKSMDCIRVFREEAIQFSEEQHFNSFLKALREKVEVKQLNHFWEIVIQDGITLITKDEASGSSVTAEEAKKFLAPKENPDEDTAAVCEEGGDVDDLVSTFNI